MKGLIVTPTIESTEAEPRYYLYLNECGESVQIGEIHELSDGSFKAWSFRRIPTESKHKESAVNYIVQAYAARNTKAQKITKSTPSLFQ